MSAARDLSVGYAKAPESKTPFNMRAPKSLMLKIDEVIRLWVMQAKARGDDPTNIDKTHVAVTLLQTATDAEFDVYGGRPKDEAAWKEIEQKISEGVQRAQDVVTKLRK